MIPITIVSLNGDTNSGGVERVVFYLKNILAERYSVSVLKKNGGPRRLDKLVFPFIFSLLLYFKKKSLVISNSWQAFLYPADFSIHHGTSAGFIKAAARRAGAGSRILAIMEKISARRAKKVIAVSVNCKRELEELYRIPPGKCVVLNNFVDERFFFPIPSENGSSVSHAAVRILFSGRLEERKGLSKLIKLATALEDSKEFRLHIASNSPLNANCFSSYKNTLIRSGLDIDGMRSFYNSGDILYFPSQYEGFSMATLEALSCGVPVIGTRYAVPEELQRYEFTRIFEGDDTGLLLKAVKELYLAFRDRRKAIHAAVSKDFGYEQYREKLFSLIE
jgi:glycosyltransferase involved in cell wall biosynthesis